MWGHVYDVVTTKAGRYVQGGGCLTVGVAGLVQSGGFGNFSKAYGTAAASLLEAEIVTADGAVRIANACTNPDLFWGIKGGGGGSLGVVTRLTLRTHELPAFFGAVFATVKASSPEAFRRLIARVIEFYADALFNPHWGEQITFRPGNELGISMVFQGLDRQQAEAIWRPFFDWIHRSPKGLHRRRRAHDRRGAGPELLGSRVSQAASRTGARRRPSRRPSGQCVWASNLGEAGQVLHGYRSAWIPASFLHGDGQEALAGALFRAAQHWSVALHVNKGLAGAPDRAVAAARDTATNPAVLEAFALAISGAEGPPAYPGIPGHEPDPATARREAAAVGRAMDEVRNLLPSVGSYVSESDFFETAWQDAFWGPNYARLRAVKDKYDPDGLFFVHHGVGSEGWSADGFTRVREGAGGARTEP